MSENPNIQQEIAQLEQQLAEKRASLEQGASETGQEAPHEKEILRQVVGEKIQEYAPSYQPSRPSPVAVPNDDKQSYNNPQLIEKVQELINIAFDKSIGDAVRAATQSGNPALIDAFHDVIVDQLYDTLLERKKLEQVK